MALACLISPVFPTFPYVKHCFQCQFLFPRCKLCLRYMAGNFNKNPKMRAVAKFCEHEQASTQLIFWEQFEQRPNFASTFKLVETIRYPSVSLCHFIIATRPLSEAIIRLTLHELLLDSLHLFMKNV